MSLVKVEDTLIGEEVGGMLTAWSIQLKVLLSQKERTSLTRVNFDLTVIKVNPEIKALGGNGLTNEVAVVTGIRDDGGVLGGQCQIINVPR